MTRRLDQGGAALRASASGIERHQAWRSPGFLLWHTTLRWQREVAAALKPLGLTHAQFVLLASVWWLETQGGHPSQRELAAHAGTDGMMTSQVVRVLERRALLTRSPDPSDGRVRRLATTRAGREQAVRAVEVVDALDERFFAPAAEDVDLLHVFRKLSGRVGPHGELAEGA